MKILLSAKNKINSLTSNYAAAYVFRIVILSLIFVGVMDNQLRAEGAMNYTDKKALIVNNCPFIQLGNFYFENRYERNSYRFAQSMTWTNSGGQSIIAFDIVILRYDPFNDRIYGTKWTVTGINSQNWMPLSPGYTGTDIMFSMNTEDVFTCIAYVRAARLANGSIWRADMKKVLEGLQEVAPDFTSFGDLNGEIKLRSF